MENIFYAIFIYFITRQLSDAFDPIIDAKGFHCSS